VYYVLFKADRGTEKTPVDDGARTERALAISRNCEKSLATPLQFLINITPISTFSDAHGNYYNSPDSFVDLVDYSIPAYVNPSLACQLSLARLSHLMWVLANVIYFIEYHSLGGTIPQIPKQFLRFGSPSWNVGFHSIL
jgi:hypothetical protein